MDGAFTKNFFLKAEAANAALDYIDPKRPALLPFTYMGFDREFPHSEKEVCERWLGSAGESIYHIHEADEPRWETLAGGDVLRRKRDAGRAYILLTSHSQFWSVTALRSFSNNFASAEKRCGTHVDGLLPEWNILNDDEEPLSARCKSELEFMKSRVGMHRHKVGINIDFSDRFLAKVALGIGCNILGSRYTTSSYANSLRELLWFQRDKGDYPPDLRGSNFWQNSFEGLAAEYLGWKGAWTILIRNTGDLIAYTLSTPTLRTMSLAISDDPSMAGELSTEYNDGVST